MRTRKRWDLEPSRIGAEVCSPSPVSLGRMQLVEAVLCRFRDRPYVVYGWVARARANIALSCQFSVLREGEEVCSWFPAEETTRQAAVPTEPEADQTLLGPMGSRGLGEK